MLDHTKIESKMHQLLDEERELEIKNDIKPLTKFEYMRYGMLKQQINTLKWVLGLYCDL